MTDQARKRAEEYFVREWDVIDLMSRDYIIDSHIDGQKVGHASALEEIGKVADAEHFYAYQSDVAEIMPRLDLGDSRDLRVFQHPMTSELPHLIRFVDEKPALLEIATLRAQLEKCKEQRELNACEYIPSLEHLQIIIEQQNAELEALK